MLTMGGPAQNIGIKNSEPQERPTKWGKEVEKTFNPPSFHAVARGISLHDVEYLMRLYRLDELIKKKNLGQLDLNDRDARSPSPEPIYDKEGKRLNTTEQRMKDEMMLEIQILIDECKEMNPKFVAPHEFRNLKKSRKIYLPESSDGHNNFAGLILGHKGENQKRIEAKSGCKISLRGRQAYMVRSWIDLRNGDMGMTRTSRRMCWCKRAVTSSWRLE
jgi:splicing factor 1